MVIAAFGNHRAAGIMHGAVKLGCRDILGLKTGRKETRQYKNNGGDSDYEEMPQATSQHGWCSLAIRGFAFPSQRPGGQL